MEIYKKYFRDYIYSTIRVNCILKKLQESVLNFASLLPHFSECQLNQCTEFNYVRIRKLSE